MQGVAVIDDKVFVVFASCKIEKYDAQTLNLLSVIKVRGLKNARDIVACHDNSQLYVAQSDCVWQVSSTDRHKYIKWLGPESTADIYSLSLSSQNLVITSAPRSLHIYRKADRRLQHGFELEFVTFLWHGVETSRGTFVVSYNSDTLEQELKHAVSKLCFFCCFSILSYHIVHNAVGTIM